MAELKAMMNQIPVPVGPSAGTAIGAKVALWAGVAVILTAGLYFYLADDETKPLPADTTTVQPENSEEETTTSEVTTQTEEQTEDLAEPTAEVSETVPVPSEKKPAKTPEPELKKENDAPVSSQPKIDVYDPMEDIDPTEASNDPVVKTDTREKEAPSIEVEIDSQNKKYTFHYQFKNGKLLLYGPFEKNLYEILEFFHEDKRTIFLFYGNQYYLLNEESERLKPLDPIKDPALVKKLKEYRNN